MNNLSFLAGMSLLLVSCTTPDPNAAPRIAGPAGSVTRAEAIEIVNAYVNTAWLADDRHKFHGKDSAAIEVHTPDFHTGKGWWKTGQVNCGMPYKWGGFDTPKSFVAGLKVGRYAGDISSSYKRRNLEAAVSRESVGIDCSGLISRAWRLDRSYSTRELPQLCERLPSWDDLQPGDILNRYNGHALMFGGWIGPIRPGNFRSSASGCHPGTTSNPATSSIATTVMP